MALGREKNVDLPTSQSYWCVCPASVLFTSGSSCSLSIPLFPRLCPGPRFQSRIYIAFRCAAPFCWCIIKHVFWKMKEADDKRDSLWFPSELQSQPHFPAVYLSFPLLRLRSFIICPPPVPSASFLPFTPIRSIFCFVLHFSSVFIFHQLFGHVWSHPFDCTCGSSRP